MRTPTPDQLEALRVLGDIGVPLATAAELADMHPYSLTRLEGQGRFPARLATRTRPFYRASDLIQWLTGSWGQPPAARQFLRSHRRVG